MPKSPAIAVRLDKLAEVRELANLEIRTLSGMVNKLVDEALAARHAAEEGK